MPSAARGFVFLIWSVSLMSVEGEERPVNVLFIMSDQHNVRAIGCSGNPQIKTPVLDQLAADGVRFSNAFCQTGQCCPSRYTIWTGRYAHSHGCRWNNVPEPLEEVTVGEIFKKAGYATATIGKHHMVHSPTKHGFDVVIDQPEYRAFLKAEKQPPMLASVDKMEQPTSAYTGISRAPNRYHPTGFWAAKTIEFLKANRDKPFCAWLSFYGPHTPIIPSKRWAAMYDPDEITLPGNYPCKLSSSSRMMERAQEQFRDVTSAQHREMLARYYGFVSQIDYNIGLVLEQLDQLGLADNTVVVYTADHGEMAGEYGLWTKFVLNYDATVHVPLIIRVPNVLPKGVVVEELVGLIDLLPTLCDLANLPTPSQVQGKSLVELSQGRPVEWRDVIFSEIGYPGRASGRCVLARTHTHAFLQHENYGQPFEELYDLMIDPWQTRNVVHKEDYQTVRESLGDAIVAWEKSTDHADMIPVGPNPGRTRRSAPRPQTPARDNVER